MIYEVKPDRVAELAIILNDHKPFTDISTLNKNGWDVICNGDMCNFALDSNGYAVFNYFCRVNKKTLCPLPDANGKVNCYHEWVMAWNNGDTKITWIDPYPISNMEKYDNVIGCTGLITDGKIRNPILSNSAIGGTRARTAIGTKADGTIIFWCTKDGYAGDTLENLAKKLLDAGCVNANALDGGGSSQLICPDGKILTSRLIYNFVGLKLKKTTTQTTTTAHTNDISTDPSKQFYVQCGAYYKSGLSYAEKLQTKIINAGFSNAVVRLVSNTYRVQVGPYNVKNDAVNALNKLKAKGISGYVTPGNL